MFMYRWLLRLYPASFRNEYGEEMRAAFARRRRDAGGAVAATLLWFEAVADLVLNAALTHWDLLKQDVGYTVRTLRRAPGFAVAAVLIVALGIGATTAAFSVTDFALLRPLPFPDPDRLVKIWEHTATYSRLELSPANYRDWKQGSTSFASIGAYHPLAVNVTGRGEPLRLEGAAVSSDLFSTLGVLPLAGRWFREEDDREGAPGTVILSYQLWQVEFGGGPVVGETVMLDNAPYTIVGVMPHQFSFPNSDSALWTTMRFGESNYQDRNDNWLEAVGRLGPGVTIERARAEWEVRAAQSRQQYPKENENIGAFMFLLRDEVSRRSRLLLEALSGAALCVLLIACANLANLLLTRALGRRRELGVRAALGAGRERLARQLMTESMLLALAGGALGVAIAVAAVPLLAQLVPSTMPTAAGPAVDVRVLLFAAALTAITGMTFGLAPVLRVGSGVDLRGLREGVRAGGGRKEGLRTALVVAEIIASIVLLVSAGLLMRTLWNVRAVDPGFRPEGVLTMQTALALPKYGTVAARDVFYNRVLTDVRALPGVSSAAYISFVPVAFGGGIWPVSLTGNPTTRAEDQTASLRYVTPGYFATLGIPLKRGRDVSESDERDHSYAAVVSDSFARRYWSGEDPIGRHFQFAFHDRMVVGVVGDVRVRGLERPSEPQVYIPYRQVDDNEIIGYIPKDLVVRTSVSPTGLTSQIRAIIRRVDPQQPVSNVRTMTDIIDVQTASRSVQLRVIGAFATIAFLLAVVGIHGVLSFAVSERVQEIGVRMALGAQAGDILNLVVRRGVTIAVAAAVPGVALAYAAGLAMQALLVGVTPADAPTFLAVAGVVVLMTIAGTLMPTLRALKIDPISAIRTE